MRSATAFTFIEVLLAMVVSSVIVISAYGLLGYIRSADQGMAEEYQDIQELGYAHEVVRQAMVSLVALETPEEEPEDQDGAAGRSDEDSAAAARAGPPLMVLGPTEPEATGPQAPKMLLLTLKSPPVRTGDNAAAGGVVRGAFELVPYRLAPHWQRDGALSWALLWTPLEPSGDPVVLAEELEAAQWALLGKDNQWRPDLRGDIEVDEFPEVRARFEDEYPRGLRLILWTWSGRRVDWLFEPVVEVRRSL